MAVSEKDKKIFAENLKHYMEKSDKSQREIAEIVGVSAPTVNEWLRRKKYPRMNRIQTLADYFGIMKSDLIEEKVTEEKNQKNDNISNIITRLRNDDTFFSVIVTIDKLNRENLEKVRKILSALF